MIHGIPLTAIILLGALMLLTVLGIVLAVLMPGIDRWNRLFFIVFFSSLIPILIFFITDPFIYGKPDLLQEEMTRYYISSILLSVLMLMPSIYLLHCCMEKQRESRLFRAVTGLLILYYFLLTLTQFCPFLYYYTPDNHGHRTVWYPLLLVPLAGIMILNLIGVIRRRRQLHIKYFRAFLIYLIPLTAVIMIYMIIDNALLLFIGITIPAFSMFGIILSDQIDQYLRQQREIAHQRASIMVLQMRPHFIYNTMASIYYLCVQDPEKAQQVTLDFTTYLRKNFTAIASETTIPFTEELAHTRAYLAVEQAQFEDRLFIDYDTPHTHFHLPPLTLQPIVENAVKHGMDPDSEPLRISIRTRETAYGSEIIVEDNGTGFDPAEDGSLHIALENICQRLNLMCHGRMLLSPRKGGGTIVRVIIP